MSELYLNIWLVKLEGGGDVCTKDHEQPQQQKQEPTTLVQRSDLQSPNPKLQYRNPVFLNTTIGLYTPTLGNCTRQSSTPCLAYTYAIQLSLSLSLTRLTLT